MTDLIAILGLFRRRLWWIGAGAAIALVTLVAGVGLLALAGWFLTATALAGLTTAAALTFDVYRPSAGIRFFAFLRTGSRYAERVVTHEATFRILADIRVWFFRRAIPLAPGRLGGLRSGDLLGRITADVDALEAIYLRGLVPIAVAVVAAALAFVVLLGLDPVLAVAVVGMLALAGVALPAVTGGLGAAPGAAIVATTARLRGRVVETLGGLAELRVLGAASRQLADLAAETARLAALQRRMGAIAGLGAAAATLLQLGAMWVALYLVLGLVDAGRESAPMATLVVLMVLGLFEAIAPLPSALQALGRTRAAASRVRQLAAARPASPDPEAPAPLPRGFALAFEGVAFRYAPLGPPVLGGLDLVVGEGERVVLAGPSGAGKSSLIGLTLRFWSPTAGRILLGGTPIDRLAGDAVRSRIACLPQRADFFDGTLRENLLIADPAADEATLRDALAAVRLDGFASRLPSGLETRVGEGGLKLSGGQSRRLALARVFLRDAAIVLLDEPTEGLDPETERAIAESLDERLAGRTLIVATHRPEAFAGLSRQIRLDQGRVVSDRPIADRARRA